MVIQTRDFGVMELDENDVLTFSSPIYGYEGLTKYVLLGDDEAGPGLMWLQSVENTDVCFVLLDPVELGLPYFPELPGDAEALLQLKDAPAYRLIAVVPENFKDTTVNLKSPIVINPDKKLAAQVILEGEYPIRMRLFDTEET